MNEILDQDAIDALLDGLNEGSVDTRPQEPEDPAAVRVYDFSTQTRIVRGRMPTLEMINERLARSLRTSLFRMLRRSPEVEVLGISTPKYADYVPTLKVPTSLNQIRFHPLTGTGLLIFEAGLIFTIIDALFGGRGRHAKIEGREFTLTEEQILGMLLGEVIEGMESAWAPVFEGRVEHIGSEMNPHFANIVSPTEIVVVSRLRVDLDGRGGEIHVTLPYAMIEPIKDTLRAGMKTDRIDSGERWSQLLRNELEEATVDLVARVGTAELPLRSLLAMKPGDIIPCDFDGTATVFSDGIELFRGELGQSRGRHVVRVDRMALRKSGSALDAFARKMP
ncbi:MAG: flagellar motor switch protein FliM [Pseudomonadota bacterium]|nr:MAG: flagellar motor switch protein FliM [Pseudomonadota bacterium]